MKTLLFLFLLVSPAFAQSKEDALQLENYQLRMLLIQNEYKEVKEKFDALKAKVDAIIEAGAKPKTESQAKTK